MYKLCLIGEKNQYPCIYYFDPYDTRFKEELLNNIIFLPNDINILKKAYPNAEVIEDDRIRFYELKFAKIPLPKNANITHIFCKRGVVGFVLDDEFNVYVSDNLDLNSVDIEGIVLKYVNFKELIIKTLLNELMENTLMVNTDIAKIEINVDVELTKEEIEQIIIKEVSDRMTSLYKIFGEFREVIKENRDLREALRQKDGRIRELNREIGNMRLKIYSLEKEFWKATKEKESLEERVRELEEENKKLKRRLRCLKKKLKGQKRGGKGGKKGTNGKKTVEEKGVSRSVEAIVDRMFS